MELFSELTCPNCGQIETHEMPTQWCQHAWICVSCSFRVTPKTGDCCVYCSYGSVICPVRQQEQS
ncbi:GDCCVxC domain-containing (seleno)protein [Candidatus Aquiluna sp. IMCC13023]|uniref:GDCCVxC domain-containing (seleno)protein n=1 Tax=Candidatus Aquiluna sp. IMCC13023 TaxID=1081644 RepID=UPI0009DA1DFE|nr:GDCCVxC domain-containing (seleno)protein [Candidatus Aquiluna sp. IMCC13023]